MVVLYYTHVLKLIGYQNSGVLAKARSNIYNVDYDPAVHPYGFWLDKVVCSTN